MARKNPSAKNNFSLQFTGLSEIMERLEKLDASIEKTTELALIQSKEYVNKGIEQAMMQSKYDFKRTGRTEQSLDKNKTVEWKNLKAAIDIGFDIDDGGLASIFLMYGVKGTPYIEPDRKLFSAIFGSKVRKEVAGIQESIFYEALRKAELK